MKAHLACVGHSQFARATLLSLTRATCRHFSMNERRCVAHPVGELDTCWAHLSVLDIHQCAGHSQLATAGIKPSQFTTAGA